MIRRSTTPMLLAVVLLLGAAPAQGQLPESRSYWIFNYYSVEYSKLDSLMKLTRQYTLPIAEEAKKMGSAAGPKSR